VAGDVPIAVFNADGTYYAIDDTCTHQDASLADGWLDGCLVECPLHSSVFDLRTGLPTSPPAKRAVRTHRVTVEDGTIVVHVPNNRVVTCHPGREQKRQDLRAYTGTTRGDVAVKLDPAAYECPTDQTDLTKLVVDELGGDGLVSALIYAGVTGLPRLLGRADKTPREFEVIVTCPGKAGDGKPHQQACSGTYTP